MRPRKCAVRCVAALALTFVACSTPTSPSSDDILAHRARWASHHLSDYVYTYEFSAFNAFADRAIRVEVHGDTVRSAVVVSTGQSLDASFVPTIDQLFDQALANAGHSLRAITFDRALAYPAHMAFAGPPDALSDVQASALQALP